MMDGWWMRSSFTRISESMNDNLALDDIASASLRLVHIVEYK